MKSIYDFPEVYELVMARAPGVVEAEVASIQQLMAQRGVAHGRILELACGACAHGLLLAHQGHPVMGVDRSAAMLQLAERRAAQQGVTLHFVQADIVDFTLALADDARFDAAIFMYETFPVLTEYADIVQHFATVRRYMKPGGLYMIDLDARKHGVGTATGEWGRQLFTLPTGTVELWYEDFPGDWVAGTSHLRVHTRITSAGAHYQTVDDWQLRVYSPWDLRVLARTLPGWTLDNFYAWHNLSLDIGNEAHYFMVLVAV